IPLVVANARLSARSARGYRRLGGLTRPMLDAVAVIAAQGEEDARRFRELGARRVRLAGNLKYDLVPPPDLAVQGEALRESLGTGRPVLLAASTHQGEELLVLEAFEMLRRRRPDWLLVLVPRHPERFHQVAGLCRARELEVVRRSDHRRVDTRTAVFLGDSMGELLLFYAAADIAFVGGSLVAVGGHNILEPALLGKPVLFGPHMFNFADIARRLLEAGAARQVRDARTLAETVLELQEQPSKRRIMGEQGRGVVAANRGALATHLAIIEALLEGNSSAL
ncbi:MAG: 3-deoxy-D-manno-octulosonic acid transferase, partial [Candidatus Competibacteraceae bacterium]|nr:3-deoxy-D-manno-octulosonic acid transferase [Candidatus Competibacteraceae bacterium]